jgi:hypothetical protein
LQIAGGLQGMMRLAARFQTRTGCRPWLLWLKDSSMKLVPVCCQNCGASLEIGESTRFVTCQFCQTQLSVQHTGTAIFTELLGDIAKKTDQLAAEVGHLRIQNQIQQLERDWMMERESMMERSKNGSTREPTLFVAWFQGGACLAMAIFMLVMSRGERVPGSVTFGTLVCALIGIAVIVHGVLKSQKFERAKNAYLERRRALEAQLIARN